MKYLLSKKMLMASLTMFSMDENVPAVEPDHPPQDPELCTVNTPVRNSQLFYAVTGCKD